MCRLGSEIPKLKSRAERLLKEEAAAKALEAKAAKAEAAAVKKATKKKK
jgi:hypothetical protein